ncbi:hypothetical protein M5K25_015343 [Dendrobium thyrsiflorum]|uniref:Uncharacterized protein n=1 Tax=Dendrobium thyrsiflorum TaxID=117978 RepID=A0ABD0UQB1_DENTH
MKGTFGGEVIGESSKVSRAPTPPPANFRGLPPTTARLPPSHQPKPELCQITTRGLTPDVLLKARRSAQGQTLCSRPDALLKARCSAQGQMLCSRPDILLRAKRSAQGQTLCSRPDILLKARRSAQGLTFLLKARHSAEPPPDAGVLLDYRLTPELPSDAGLSLSSSSFNNQRTSASYRIFGIKIISSIPGEIIN